MVVRLPFSFYRVSRLCSFDEEEMLALRTTEYVEEEVHSFLYLINLIFFKIKQGLCNTSLEKLLLELPNLLTDSTVAVLSTRLIKSMDWNRKKSWLAKASMVLTQRSKWMYAIAGSGVVLGIFNYLQPDKKLVKNSWTSNFEPSVKWNHNWDSRESSVGDKENFQDSESKQPTARRHIFMIRHGQYNMKGKTDAERTLTELGQKQAELVGQRLKDLKFNYTKMIRSTMTRAIETSDIIHKCFPTLPLESCDLLREGAPIPPDPPSKSWNFDEQWLKDGPRIESAFKKHFHRANVSQESDSYEIMVCHANVIRYFICRLLQFPPEAWLRFQLHHCSITWVVIMPSGRVGVYGIGDSGFFDYDHMTG